MIRVPQVRVLDEDGSQMGVMPTAQAQAMAQERGLDLVEVAPTAAPPVVRFLDYGQYKYELTKREKEAKRKQRAVEFKEVRLTPKIGTGDFETKVHRAIEFLEDGDRIKVTVRFRGRELTHPEIGRNLLAKFGDRVKDHGTVDRSPALEGKSMFMTLASVHKPRTHEHRIATGKPEDAPSVEPEAPVAAGIETPVDAEPGAPAAVTATAESPASAKRAEPVEPATATPDSPASAKRAEPVEPATATADSPASAKRAEPAESATAPTPSAKPAVEAAPAGE
jgi:translation initiation factor IF-3